MPRSNMPGTRATSFCWAICRPWTTSAVVCGVLCSPQPREPAPAAVGKLHLGQPLHAVLDHLADLGLVEDRVAIVTLPLLGPLGVVADLLGVEVGPLLA